MPNIIEINTNHTLPVVSFINEHDVSFLVPVSVLKEIIDGKRCITSLNGWREIVKAMCAAEIEE